MTELTQENEVEIKTLILQFGSRAVEEFKGEKVGGLTPSRTDNYLSMISAYSAMLEERLGELEVQRATDYPNFRTNYKSNVDATMAWDSTVEGLEMIKLKRTLKATDKVIAACKNRLNRLQNESYNRY
jgi:hypothetical protein